MTTETTTETTTDTPGVSQHHNLFMNDPDRPIYVVGSLMQFLPAEISDIKGLTQRQSKMAAAVAHYAAIIYDTNIDGIAEIGKLMHKAGSECPVSMSVLGRLIQHLSYEAQFMQQASQDYGDAANEPCLIEEE
jgi:hypothetical protein